MSDLPTDAPSLVPIEVPDHFIQLIPECSTQSFDEATNNASKYAFGVAMSPAEAEFRTRVTALASLDTFAVSKSAGLSDEEARHNEHISETLSQTTLLFDIANAVAAGHKDLVDTIVKIAEYKTLRSDGRWARDSLNGQSVTDAPWLLHTQIIGDMRKAGISQTWPLRGALIKPTPGDFVPGRNIKDPRSVQDGSPVPRSGKHQVSNNVQARNEPTQSSHKPSIPGHRAQNHPVLKTAEPGPYKLPVRLSNISRLERLERSDESISSELSAALHREARAYTRITNLEKRLEKLTRKVDTLELRLLDNEAMIIKDKTVRISPGRSPNYTAGTSKAPASPVSDFFGESEHLTYTPAESLRQMPPYQTSHYSTTFADVVPKPVQPEILLPEITRREAEAVIIRANSGSTPALDHINGTQSKASPSGSERSISRKGKEVVRTPGTSSTSSNEEKDFVGTTSSSPIEISSSKAEGDTHKTPSQPGKASVAEYDTDGDDGWETVVYKPAHRKARRS